jgi:hypothetical protein
VKHPSVTGGSIRTSGLQMGKAASNFTGGRLFFLGIEGVAAITGSAAIADIAAIAPSSLG